MVRTWWRKLVGWWQAKAPASALPEPEPEPVPEPIRFTHVRISGGRVSWWGDCEGCYELQVAYAIGGPWYPESQASCATPADVAVLPSGSDRYYRAVSVPCVEPEQGRKL